LIATECVYSGMPFAECDKVDHLVSCDQEGQRADGAHLQPSLSLPEHWPALLHRKPVPLMDFIGCIEERLGRQAEKRMLPMEAGDVAATCADTAALEPWIDFAPSTPPSAGIVRLVDWSRHYYQV
jgi:hypothetical protein